MEERINNCREKLSELFDDYTAINEVFRNTRIDLEELCCIDYRLKKIENLMEKDKDEGEKELIHFEKKLNKLYNKEPQIIFNNSNKSISFRKENPFINIDSYKNFGFKKKYFNNLMRLECFVDEMLNLSDEDYFLEKDGSIEHFFDKYIKGFRKLSLDDSASIIRELYYRLEKLDDYYYEKNNGFSDNKSILSELDFYLTRILLRKESRKGNRTVKKYLPVRNPLWKKNYYLVKEITRKKKTVIVKDYKQVDDKRKNKFYLYKVRIKRRMNMKYWGEVLEKKLKEYDEEGNQVKKKRKIEKNDKTLYIGIDTDHDGNYDKKKFFEYDGEMFTF